MAPSLPPILGDSSTTRPDTSSRGKEPEARKPSSVHGNGSNLSINGVDKAKGSKGVFTGGPYLLDDNSMTSLSNGKTTGASDLLDGSIFAKFSSTTDEGRFQIPHPYQSDASDALKAVDFGRDNSLDMAQGSESVSSQVHTQPSGHAKEQIYDPDGFGDDPDDYSTSGVTSNGLSASPVESTPSGLSLGSRTTQDKASITSSSNVQHPPQPGHAPPPVPVTGSYPPAAKKAVPPAINSPTRRLRAQSDSSPPISPPPPSVGLLHPPAHDSHRHRKSSPPAPRVDQSTLSLAGPIMPRLQQRHTLQVPNSAALALQRDVASSSGDEGFGKSTSPTVSNRRTSMNLIRRHSRNIQSDAQLHQLPQDEDATRRAEATRQRLAARRKRKEEEEDDRVLVGTRVDQNHQNWVTAYNMLTGIRFTVSRTNAKVRDRDLTDADFTGKHKYAFDVAGTELTPSAKYDFKFKDYAPQVFKELRSMFGIDPADYLVSLTSKILLSELASPGKSKSFFYFSRDYKYIIKTVHHAEHKLLRKILPRYFNHVKDNPNTLLSQFYGLHRIKSTWGAHKTHFVVMNNLFPPHRDIHQTYDLKGSTVGRELSEGDLDRNPRGTLKDLNWLKRKQHLAFGPVIKSQFIQQMERDVDLLKELGIMDYSLLVGIHDLTKGNQEGLRDKTLKVYQPGGTKDKPEQLLNRDSVSSAPARTPSTAEKTKQARELRANLRKEKPVSMNQAGIDMPDSSAADRRSRMFTKDDGGIQAEHEDGSLGEEIYYLGIIDCLTKYGFVKRLEHFVKGLSNDKNAISAVQPRAYGDRFVQFMKGISKTDEEAAREKQAEQPEKPRQSNSFPLRNSSVGANTHPIGSPINEMTSSQQQAEKKARNSTENTTAEEHQRTLGTVKSDGPQEQVTLPILEEVGEAASTSTNEREGGRTGSHRSTNRVSNTERERSVGSSSMQRQQSSGSHSIPPPARAAPHAPVYGGRPPPTPPKEMSPQIGAPSDTSGGFHTAAPGTAL